MEKINIWNFIVPVLLYILFYVLLTWGLVISDFKAARKSASKYPRAFKTPKEVEDVFEDTDRHYHPPKITATQQN
jgi:hypothetical protein